MKIMPGVSPVVAATEADAHESGELQELIPVVSAWRCWPAMSASATSTRYPIDRPMPELPERGPEQPSGAGRRAMATRRPFRPPACRPFRRCARPLGCCRHAGADRRRVAGWFEGGGGRLQRHATYSRHRCLCELVVPELQRRGLFRPEYEGKTLRENLGLKRPA